VQIAEKLTDGHVFDLNGTNVGIILNRDEYFDLTIIESWLPIISLVVSVVWPTCTSNNANGEHSATGPLNQTKPLNCDTSPKNSAHIRQNVDKHCVSVTRAESK
jgi:hypothetical protein